MERSRCCMYRSVFHLQKMPALSKTHPSAAIPSRTVTKLLWEKIENWSIEQTGTPGGRSGTPSVRTGKFGCFFVGDQQPFFAPIRDVIGVVAPTAIGVSGAGLAHR